MVEFESQQHWAGWSKPGALTLLQPCKRLAWSQATSSHWLIQSALSCSWVLHTQVQPLLPVPLSHSVSPFEAQFFVLHCGIWWFSFQPISLVFQEYLEFNLGWWIHCKPSNCDTISAFASWLFVSLFESWAQMLPKMDSWSTPKAWLWTDKIEQDVLISFTFMLKGLCLHHIYPC